MAACKKVLVKDTVYRATVFVDVVSCCILSTFDIHRKKAKLNILEVRNMLFEVFFIIYYPPEVSSVKYCCLGVFRKEYFRLITN